MNISDIYAPEIARYEAAVLAANDAIAAGKENGHRDRLQALAHLENLEAIEPIGWERAAHLAGVAVETLQDDRARLWVTDIETGNSGVSHAKLLRWFDEATAHASAA